MATDVTPQIDLQPLNGDARTLEQWVFNFPMLLVVLDPYTEQSAQVLHPAKRLFDHYEQASVRVAWLITCDATDAQAFLGPLGQEILTFVDPDRAVVQALGVERIPSLVFIDAAATVRGIAPDWNPPVWKPLLAEVSEILSWSPAPLHHRDDPEPFGGTPAAG